MLVVVPAAVEGAVNIKECAAACTDPKQIQVLMSYVMMLLNFQIMSLFLG